MVTWLMCLCSVCAVCELMPSSVAGVCTVHVLRYKRKSLKILGSVGEPINPEAWLWYHNVVGDGRCAIVDTFWQTETVSSFICVFSY